MSPLPTSDRVEWTQALKCLGREGLLSVVMPCHNLGGTITENVARVATTFRGRIPFEIVAVDDGSNDDTLAELRLSGITCPELTIVPLSPNQGKGHALRTGFGHAKGTHCLFLDGDLDLPAYQAAWFFERMSETDADIVIGAKRHPRSELVYPLRRRIISATYYMMVRLLFGLPVRDTQTGIKLFRRTALEAVLPRMLVKRFAFDLELLVIARRLGFRIAEVPVVLHFHGPYGCVTKSAIKQIMTDTLAVFYRLRILHYYQSMRTTSPPDPLPFVSVIIACPGPSPYLNECMDGLASQTYRRFEVLILPDAPTGKTWPNWAREKPTGPKRPAEKRNMGILASKGSIIAFLDDDAFPCPQWLEEAVNNFGDPAIGAVGGPGVTPPNDPLSARLSGRVLANPLVSGRCRYRYTPTRVLETDDLPSCNLLVRKQTLTDIGGFRTDFWPGEDTVLCLEIVKRNSVILYNPHVLVYHHRRKLFGPHLRQIGRYALHRGFFARRFPETSFRLSYMMPSLLLAGIVMGAVLAAVFPDLRVWYAIGLASYALVTALAAFPLETALVSERVPFKSWFSTWAGIVATHGVYGFRFLQGLLARRMPESVRAFDHVTETKE